MAITAPPSGLPRTDRISYSNFLRRYYGTKAEWVDGEVIVMGSVSFDHDHLSGLGYRMLSDWTERYELGEVMHERFQMKLERQRAGREPDVVFICNENVSRVKPTFINGPADLVIEVVSADSRERDRVTKLGEYERAGIAEYWIWDSEDASAEFHQLNEKGRYERVYPDADGVYRSKVLEGFWLKVDWLKRIPRMADIRREWGW